MSFTKPHPMIPMVIIVFMFNCLFIFNLNLFRYI